MPGRIERPAKAISVMKPESKVVANTAVRNKDETVLFVTIRLKRLNCCDTVSLL